MNALFVFIFCWLFHGMPQTVQLAFNISLENCLLLANRLVSNSLKSMKELSILRRPQRTLNLSRSRRNLWATSPFLSARNWRLTLLLETSHCPWESSGLRVSASHLTWRSRPHHRLQVRETTYFDSGWSTNVGTFCIVESYSGDGRSGSGQGSEKSKNKYSFTDLEIPTFFSL